jgi:hypothetical protein
MSLLDKLRGKLGDQSKRYSLLRAGASPVQLTQGKNFLIGRSNDANLTIQSQRISRKHTEIFWQGESALVRDCGSQNGTKVNGKRISDEVQLNDNDELEIGPFLCTFRAIPRTVRIAPTDPDNEALTMAMVSDTLAGTFNQMSPFEVLQTLEFNQKTGTLTVFGDEDATLVVKDGRPLWAQTGDILGNEAIVTMLMWTEGQFNFSSNIDADIAEVNVQGSITNLLFEAGRRMDEGQKT